MSTITFIESPEYTVDFQDFALKKPLSEEATSIQKIQNIFETFLKAIIIFIESLAQATYSTLSNSGTSFKHIVLGYHGSLRNFRPPNDIYLAVFKTVFWIFGMAWCTVKTTTRLFHVNMWGKPSTAGLDRFNNEINMKHIQTKDLSLDPSKVPSNVKIDDLAEMLTQINFTDPNLPGYMAPKTRQEISRTYSEEELTASLNVFINHVNKRVAFLGTPPSYDTPRLMSYYQQIEDAVRLSIHKVNQQLENFTNAHGSDYSAYEKEQQRQYQDILETRARVPLDLALAGLHCGARYMGDSMSIYYGLHSDALGSEESLQENLISILASKRKAIAEGQIQKHFSNDYGLDTHKYNKYMANLGEILALPGTQDIIEHLDTSFDRELYLTEFFKAYSVDEIIDAIQDEIKKSDVLREKIQEWLENQVKEWKKKENSENVSQTIEEIKSILNEDDADITKDIENLNDLNDLIHHLKNQIVLHNSYGDEVIFPREVEWPEFWQKIFLLDETSQWIQETFSYGGDEREERKKIGELKDFCRVEKLGVALLQEFKNIVLNDLPLNTDLFADSFKRDIKALKIKKEISKKMDFVLQADTTIRILKGEADVDSVIQSVSDRKRKQLFLENFLCKFNRDAMEKAGLSSDTIESAMMAKEKEFSIKEAIMQEFKTEFEEIEYEDDENEKDKMLVNLKNKLYLENMTEEELIAKFGNKVSIRNMENEGLPTEILEWLLVSHEIFLPSQSLS